MNRSTFQLLRFHFSLFLLPVYLFALSQLNEIHLTNAVLIFFILHILVYPSSNGYNSYMDRDETPIGGLSKPMQPTKQLFYTTIALDIIAVTLGAVVSLPFASGVLLYILASRAYSYRGIRLKKYPFTGYLTVVICQGALVFFLSYYGSAKNDVSNIPWLPALIASCLIGGYYPLTQVYQHDEDKKDGVRTISYVLGKKGTFLFCGIVFTMATIAMFFAFQNQHSPGFFWLFLACMSPMALFFSWWMVQVWKSENAASFKNSLIMNLLASVCTSAGFLIIIILKQF